MTHFRLAPSVKDLQDPSLRKLASNPCNVPLIHARALGNDAKLLKGGKLDLESPVFNVATSYLATRYDLERPWLIYAGSASQGKSLAACWILRQEYLAALEQRQEYLRQAGYEDFTDPDPIPPPGRFVTGHDIVCSPPWEAGGNLSKWAEVAGTVVIDDLNAGWVDTKDSFTGKVEGLLLARYNNLLPTVITTNLSVGELQNRYPRVVERCRQIGKMCEVNGPSLR